jgi:protein TonB
MLKRLVALLASGVIPFTLFIVVVSLNETDLERDKLLDKQVNFDVEKQKKIRKPKPKQTPKPRRRQALQKLPTVKPSDIGGESAGGGLDFGVPPFNEAAFADIDDDGLLNAVAGKAMDKDVVDTAPRVIRRSPIIYPELARKQGISGYVEMNVLIDESGNVEDVNIIDSKPPDIFDLKADSTIRSWKFEPATYNGKKVKVWALQKIVFKLE